MRLRATKRSSPRYACGTSSFSAAFGAQGNLAISPILYFGTPDQQSRYLPKLISGETVGAYALSESGSGSDALGASARAVKALRRAEDVAAKTVGDHQMMADRDGVHGSGVAHNVTERASSGSEMLHHRREVFERTLVGEETIERPLFATGEPRSGTTLLHALLAVDPNGRVEMGDAERGHLD